MKKKPVKILFLYTELAAYNFPCFLQLINEGHELLVIRYPVNKEAPFIFFDNNIQTLNKHDLNLKQIIDKVTKFMPDIIYCSGWIDKDYLKVCKLFKKSAITIVGFDNQWIGSIKQRLATFASFYFIKPYFEYAWVPGVSQEIFAKKLGFLKEKILNGFYSADVDFFNEVYSVNKEIRKRFIFSGRYYHFKGVKDLWQAFIELQEEQSNDWELWCLGVGDIEPVKHPKIKHFGFIQPSNLQSIMKETDVFILPSLFEPWGVVVHEFAAAGFPIICSNKVGAASRFLVNENNGFLFEAGNIHDLKCVMKKIISMPENDLIEMGKRSHELAQTITPQIWAKTLLSIIN